MMENYTHIYFIGIGGIGMSALARYFKRVGKEVTGYDRSSTTLTQQLESSGIDIIYEDDPQLIPDEWLIEKENLLVVYTPAVPQTNRIFSCFLRKEFTIKKRSEVLAAICNEMKGIAVAGTHGKTTTSATIAHLLTQAGVGCTAFLGGIASGYDTNLLLSGSSDLCVMEADEFDRSFHFLKAEIAVITNIDPDHLDVYGNEAEFIQAFNVFAAGIKKGGLLIMHEDIQGLQVNQCEVMTYGFSENADIRPFNIEVENGRFYFQLSIYGELRGRFAMPLPGRHNILNAAAAVAACDHLGAVNINAINKALFNFKGVKRRFEFRIRNSELVYIDDYAHHPTEIEATIASVKELYPGKHLTVVFQPHLYSRTRDFMQDFAHSLSKADELILLDIYPAREEPIEGISSEALLSQVTLANKSLFAKEALIGHLKERDLEILLTLGAGDIDRMVEPIETGLLTATQS